MPSDNALFVAAPIFRRQPLPRAQPVESWIEQRFEAAREAGGTQVTLREHEWKCIQDELARLRGQVHLLRGGM